MESEPRNILEFARALGVSLYEWQKEILVVIEEAAPFVRKKLAVRAPNGVGKTQRIIALSALRWMQRFPKGRVVITSFDARQIADQLWPAIQAQLLKFPAWKSNHAEHVLSTPQGGKLRAFTTDDPGRAEGFHSDPNNAAPLLIIVDEAKSITKEILQAVDRCSYNVLLYISSPGLKSGPFYEAFTVKRASFITFAVGLKDCPHISQAKVDDIVATYGENDPYTRSTLYGEFMSHSDDVVHVLELDDIESNQKATIDKIQGHRLAGIDFAGGRAQNVLALRNGNYCERIQAWREKDTHAAVGRFILLFNELKLFQKDIWGDADGLGGPMINTMAAARWRINCFHGAAKSPHPRYKNLVSYAWHETARKIKAHQIIVPENQALIAQLTSRRSKYELENGKLGLEDKVDMRSRGVDSPDVADAFCIAFGVQPLRAVTIGEQESRFAEIARQHNWQYSGQDEINEDGGRPGKEEALSAFGVHGTW